MILVDPAATEEAGRALSAQVRIGDVIALSGELGTGKTTLARGLLAGLGLAEEAPSPSYALVIPYDVPAVRVPVWHVDLYRLDGPEETQQLALEEGRQVALLIIEWPERLGNRLWKDALHLHLLENSDGRHLTVRVPPSWEGRCPLL